MTPLSRAWPAVLPPPRRPGGPYRICLVCLGNICRSPMAETVLRAELDRLGLGEVVAVDSAGTGDWHVGGPMDRRARAELARHGYDGARHTARQFQRSWLADRDLVLALDRYNLADLRSMAGDSAAERDRIRLLRSFDPQSGDDAEVPDPYDGDTGSFGTALGMIQAAARGLAEALGKALAGERRAQPGG